MITIKKLKSLHRRALSLAEESPDSQTKVAAFLISRKTGVVISEGYNGFIRGAPDSKLPNTRPDKYSYIVHAESNLLCNAVRHGISSDEQLVFCLVSPCIQCVRMLWQAGISEIYFKDKYSDFEASSAMLDLKIETQSYGDFFYMKLSPRASEVISLEPVLGVEL